jgi:glutamyl-tRNA(Gln) amidotransferase subunit E
MALPPLPVLDWEEIGLMAGVEVHQQLATEKKLFCRCPVRTSHGDARPDAELLRHMRPTLSEMGAYDGTALMEFKTQKNVHYLLYRDNVCTYEMDDTPPFPPNQEALEIALEASVLLGCEPVDEVHVSRKQYLDGSIPTGFQRTAIVASEGWVPVGARRIRVAWVTLEEDACRERGDSRHEVYFATDRLGTPLIETITHPDCRTPEEVAGCVAAIARAVRLTGKMRRGIGAARQDVNVSIRGGTRCEIKGVPRIPLIPRLVAGEALRQKDLLDLREELRRRGLRADDAEYAWTFVAPVETGRPGLRFAAVRLPGWAGLFSRRVGPGKTFADEVMGRVRVIACLDEMPNLAHSDAPPPDLGPAIWSALRAELGAGEKDVVVVTWADERDAKTAALEILIRAREAFDGVPNETRQVIPAEPDATTFERILPGADRMYPDTDTPPVAVGEGRIRAIRAKYPSLPGPRYEAYRAMGLSAELSRNLAGSRRAGLFEKVRERTGLPVSLVASLVTDFVDGLAADVDDVRLEECLAMLGRGELCRTALAKVVAALAAKPEAKPKDVRDQLGLTPLAKGEIETLARAVMDDAEVRGIADPEKRNRFAMGVAVRRGAGRVDGAALRGLL